MTVELSENVTQKAARLLTDGRVRLTHVSPTLVKAEVKGDTGVYRVVGDRFGVRCSCLASLSPQSVCSHALSVALVTGRFDDDG